MNKNLNRVAITITLVLLILITNCARVFRKAPLSADQITIAEIRDRVEQNYLKLSSMKARAKLSVESPQMSFMANAAINLKMPDSLMIKLSAGFGIGIGSIFIDQDQFLLYSSLDNNVYVGSSDSADFNHFLPIKLEFEDLIQVFSGIHLIKSHKKELLKIDKNQYLIMGAINNHVLKYWVEPKKFVVTEFQLLDRQGKMLVKFEYDNFIKNSRVWLPKTIRLSQPDRKTRLTIVVTNFNINKRMKEKNFKIKIPDGVGRIEL